MPDDPGEWVSIKVHAAFRGLRFLPWWWGTFTSSANPLLEIGKGGIRYRILVVHEVDYSRVESVDVRTAWRTVNLYFRFVDAVGTFSANVRHKEEALRALKLLEGRVRFGRRANALAYGAQAGIQMRAWSS